MQEVLFGNPFIFENILNYLENGKESNRRNKKEILEVILKHIDLEIKEKGEYTGIREMRKHISYYTKGLDNSSEIRSKINTITDKDELISTLKEYFK